MLHSGAFISFLYNIFCHQGIGRLDRASDYYPQQRRATQWFQRELETFYFQRAHYVIRCVRDSHRLYEHQISELNWTALVIQEITPVLALLTNPSPHSDSDNITISLQHRDTCPHRPSDTDRPLTEWRGVGNWASTAWRPVPSEQ